MGISFQTNFGKTTKLSGFSAGVARVNFTESRFQGVEKIKGTVSFEWKKRKNFITIFEEAGSSGIMKPYTDTIRITQFTTNIHNRIYIPLHYIIYEPKLQSFHRSLLR